MSFDFNSIPKFCISLKRSEIRRAYVKEQFDLFGLKVDFFDAIDKNDLIVPELSTKLKDTESPGVLACALSHIELINRAKLLNLREICIFEDDVVFCDDFKDRIKYLEQLKDFDYDIITLGGHFDKEISAHYAEQSEWKRVFKVKTMGGTYAYIIKQEVYDFILRNWNYNFGMDEFYATFVYRRFNSYAFVPFLAGCRNCKSEITEQEHVYENIAWNYDQKRILDL